MELSEKDEEYVISLLKQGKKVEAIAFVKDKTGMTLKESKDYTDKLILEKNTVPYFSFYSHLYAALNFELASSKAYDARVPSLNPRL